MFAPPGAMAAGAALRARAERRWTGRTLSALLLCFSTGQGREALHRAQHRGGRTHSTTFTGVTRTRTYGCAGGVLLEDGAVHSWHDAHPSRGIARRHGRRHAAAQQCATQATQRARALRGKRKEIPKASRTCVGTQGRRLTLRVVLGGLVREALPGVDDNGMGRSCFFYS